MKTNKKKAGIVAAAVSGVLLIGGGALAFADTPTPERGETAFVGTIKAPAETNEPEAPDGSPEEKAQDEAETSALAKLSTVSEQDATRAATDLVPGTVTKIQLDDEDGFVVWEVDITKADGTLVEVLVDAGDATNTTQEVEDADEADIVGTIKAPAETNEPEAADGSPEKKAQDQAETDALTKLATVTEQEATKAATDAVPGTVNTIKLDDEDGFVVWEADITQADGTVIEVLVDAGDASILAQEID
ncbi:MAG: PepSY domain-containing protein [Propionibacteriaceae bacterium]|nr:PepSY domain-containing protein [Propionibacteriaceae bacterium]